MRARVTGVFCGSASTLAGVLQPLRSMVGGSPTEDFVGSEPFLRAMLIEAGCEDFTVDQCRLTTQGPAGTLSRAAFAAKSAFVKAAIPGSGVDAVVSSLAALNAAVPEVGGGFVFDSYGGAINEVKADATAFAHRDALASIQYSVNWSSAAPASVIEGATSWLDSAQGTLAPVVDGAYQNYIDPTLANWESEYYGANLPRLSRVKRKYDPGDVFHFAQSVALSAKR